ncbi:hypothetical protein PV326_011295 [Microctonus aethiopoides]|nr:hypothetical protein PV326_011295 [Microctonus aethiopoides]
MPAGPAPRPKRVNRVFGVEITKTQSLIGWVNVSSFQLNGKQKALKAVQELGPEGFVVVGKSTASKFQ